MNPVVEKLKRFFIRRQQAYQFVFDEKNQHAKVVLKDLANFCRASHTTFLPDARAHAVLEGRREVWLRIEEHLKLSSDQIWALHGKDLE